MRSPDLRPPLAGADWTDKRSGELLHNRAEAGGEHPAMQHYDKLMGPPDYLKILLGLLEQEDRGKSSRKSRIPELNSSQQSSVSGVFLVPTECSGLAWEGTCLEVPGVLLATGSTLFI